MKTNLDYAQEAKLQPITDIAKKIGLKPDEIELYGDNKAKIKYSAIKKRAGNKDGKIILVTATSPTKFGEGKSTVTVGLGQALYRLKKNALICLREPSLGPVFGIKGGATGGGLSQVLPAEDINLHFTGDLHAISAANNLIAAMIDNHLQSGNVLKIDHRQISWRRAIDMNDRSLRNIVIGLGGKSQGVPREDHFDITVASEIMAVLCLSKDIEDLKARISRIIVAVNAEGNPVTVADFKAAGAVAILLKDALKPNLVQTTENMPALVHGGPFANIAHGCNSIMATKLALKMADFVVTEAGFGADLGAEKFMDIKCRIAEIKPSAVVIVTTVRALKYHGIDNLEKGLVNLGKHIENIQGFGLTPVVAVNKFPTDTEEDFAVISNFCKKMGVAVSLCEVWAKGSEGGLDLAEKILAVVDKPNKFSFIYDTEMPIKEKIEAIAKKIYGADGVNFSESANNQIARYEKWGKDKLPVCMAKTQYSFSDNPKLIGRPRDFKINIASVRLSAGAGFLVAITGEIMTMPGLPKVPAAENMNIDIDGKISGMI